MKKLFLITTLFIASFFSSLSFSETMENKNRVRVGFIENQFTLEDSEGVDLKAIITEMLSKELNYEIDLVSTNREEAVNQFKKGELDILFPIEKNFFNEEKSIYFTTNLFIQNLYLISNTKNLVDISQTNDEKIYLERNSVHRSILERTLRNNNSTAKIVEVEKIDSFKDKIVLLPENLSQDVKFRYSIGTLPATVIGVSPSRIALLEELNRVIQNRYYRIILEHKERVEKEFRYNFFISKLTEEEKIYLKTLKRINIAYEENSAVSHYISDKKEYGGLFPLIIKNISYYLDLPIVIKNKPYDSWETVLDMFDRKKVDMLAMSMTKEREKKYTFSKKVLDLNLYKITNIQALERRNQNKIGVIDNSIEERIAETYYGYKEIVAFTEPSNLISNLKNGVITGVITFDKNLVTGSGFKNEIYYSIPVSISFSQENEILKNIIDKALVYLIDKDKLARELIISEKEYLEGKIRVANLYSLWGKIVGFIALISILLGIYKIKNDQKLAKLVFVDSLTNLESRYSFDKFCKNMNQEEGVSVVIDLDNFKQANDNHGHSLGDEIILYCAQALKKIMPQARIFRISGDEYYIFMDKSHHKEILENFKKEISQSEFLRKYSISCSIGYYIKEKDIIIGDAFRFADMAMYQAKKTNGTSISKATSKFILGVQRDEFIQKNLEKAIETEFYTVFQPKICLTDSSKIIGAEALARWSSLELGGVSPLEFIPIAENMKLVGKIDFKMAEEAIKQTKIWIEEGLVGKDFRVSFNLSMYTFEQENVPERIEHLLEKYGLSGKNIEVEITESLVCKNLNNTINTLKTLKILGIKLSLDDFTAGHSTAGILAMLPIDNVKFDRSLIISRNKKREKGSMIYLSLIELIKNIGLTITAEGIEREDDSIFLKEHGVEFGQGYLYGTPMTEYDFKSKLLSIEK